MVANSFCSSILVVFTVILIGVGVVAVVVAVAVVVFITKVIVIVIAIAIAIVVVVFVLVIAVSFKFFLKATTRGQLHITIAVVAFVFECASGATQTKSCELLSVVTATLMIGYPADQVDLGARIGGKVFSDGNNIER